MSTEKVKLKYHGGGRYNHLKPKFSISEECVFIVKKQSVLQYSTKTGQLITEYQGLNQPIVGFDVVQINDIENLVVFTEDGEFRAWKTSTRFKTISKKIKCSEKFSSFNLLPDQNQEELEGIVTYTMLGKVSVALVNTAKESLQKFKVNIKGAKMFISVGKRFFAIADKRSLQFISIDNIDKSTQVFICEKKFKDLYTTCLECHKQENIVLSGDSEGKVTLWQNIFDKNPAKAIYHWHTLPVNCLAFSAAGSYFYSGGNESVLVRWDWNNSQDKKFLPRLSGNLEEIGVSSKNQLLALSTSNSAVKIVDSNLDNVSTIQHFVVGDNYDCGIILDSRTGALVMNGNVGQLQFYQPRNDNLLYSIDVVSQNKKTNERNTEIPNTEVKKFAFSKNSEWLATVEELAESESNIQRLRLKFWAFDKSRQIYELNTSINEPHQDSISSIAFQCVNEHQNFKCVTVGKDKKFKIWHKITIQQVNTERTCWTIKDTYTYGNMPCKGLSFSTDGSLMAIGFGPVLTIWTPDICQLELLLEYPKYKTDVEKVEFGRSDMRHLVVAATKDRIWVWNVMNQRLKWTVPLDVEFLLADRLSIYMGVITKKGEVKIFSPDSHEPLYENDKILSSKQIMAAAFVPTQSTNMDTNSDWYKRVELLFIDSNKELFSIGAESIEEYPIDQYMDENPDDQMVSLFNKMKPFKKISEVSNSYMLQEVEKSRKRKRESVFTDSGRAIPPALVLLSYFKSEYKRITPANSNYVIGS